MDFPLNRPQRREQARRDRRKISQELCEARVEEEKRQERQKRRRRKELAVFHRLCKNAESKKYTGTLTVPMNGGWREVAYEDGVEVGGAFTPYDWEDEG